MFHTSTGITIVSFCFCLYGFLVNNSSILGTSLFGLGVGVLGLMLFMIQEEEKRSQVTSVKPNRILIYRATTDTTHSFIARLEAESGSFGLLIGIGQPTIPELVRLLSTMVAKEAITFGSIEFPTGRTIKIFNSLLKTHLCTPLTDEELQEFWNHYAAEPFPLPAESEDEPENGCPKCGGPWTNDGFTFACADRKGCGWSYTHF